MVGRSTKVPLFQVDAFASRRFEGNPAAVMLLPAFLPDAILQAIAAENNLAETAFLVRAGTEYQIRWFTPTCEVPLCGHATLASSAVVMERLEPGRGAVVFRSRSGPLTVTRREGRYAMDFPARPSSRVPPPRPLAEALRATPTEVFHNEFNYMAVFASETEVRKLAPDLPRLAGLDSPGVIVTAPGSPPYDFVSRYFAPAKGIPEDPVTGAAHCTLAPYWAARLGRARLNAFQASRRGGEVLCTVREDRVVLEGSCVFYLEGTAEV
jgi:PhzF family phenazine biosynthesis protein